MSNYCDGVSYLLLLTPSAMSEEDTYKLFLVFVFRKNQMPASTKTPMTMIENIFLSS